MNARVAVMELGMETAQVISKSQKRLERTYRHCKTSSVTERGCTLVSAQALTTKFTVCLTMIIARFPAGSFKMRFYAGG